MLKLDMVDQVFDRAMAYCGPDSKDRNEAECVAAARRFAGLLRTDLADKLLGSLISAKEVSPEALLESAVLSLRTGATKSAVNAAMRAAQSIKSPSGLIGRIGPLFFQRATSRDYLAILEHLHARKGMSRNADLLFEMGRVRLAVGDRKKGLKELKASARIAKGTLARVYRELAVRGERRAAVNVVKSAGDDAISGMRQSDLRDICLDLIRTGYKKKATGLLSRYRAANKGIEAADEILGRVYQEMGWNRESISSFEKVRPANVTDDGRTAWLKAYFAVGNRVDAIKIAARFVESEQARGQDERTSRSLAGMAGLLVSEGMAPDAAVLFQAPGRFGRLPPALRLTLATAHARDRFPAHIEKARRMFLDTIMKMAVLSDEAVQYLRFETRKGTAEDLLRAIHDQVKSPVMLEAAWTLSCLADLAGAAPKGFDKIPASFDFANEATAGARALFRCGRWKDSYKAAMRSLDFDQAAPTREMMVETAAVSAEMAGLKGAAGKIHDKVVSLTDDLMARKHLDGIVTLIKGDYQGLYDLFAELADQSPMDGRQQLAAVEGALWEGDAGHLDRSSTLTMKRAEDRQEAAFNLSALFERGLRQDLSVKPLTSLSKAFAGDRSIARRLTGYALMSGDDPREIQAARAYIKVFSTDSDLSWLVGKAADSLSVVAVDEFLGRINELPAGVDSAGAFFKVGLMYLRIGREDEGFHLIARAFNLTRDAREFLSTLAWSALVDPDVPASLLRSAIAGNPKAMRIAADLPLVSAARCLDTAQTGGDVRRCAASIVERRRYLGVSILLGAARKALLTGRDLVGLELLKKAVTADRSRVVGTHVLDVIVSLVWPGKDMEGGLRRKFGRLGLDILDARASTSAIQSNVAYLAHLKDLAGDTAGGVRAYENVIALSPSQAGFRNNLAYMLSIRDVDLERAVHEARVARILYSRNASFYMETEAWAEYLRNRPQRAESLQETARRLWSMDQGGGLAESFLHLGRIREAVGKDTGAVRAYRRAFLAEPFERQGREALMRWRMLRARRAASGPNSNVDD
ncbi:MAG: hypothetical protein GXP54_05655 [Deltaproteobacteria bacterium]|nr:hypothetical protein [Deltaproteobacteria bacterium]